MESLIDESSSWELLVDAKCSQMENVTANFSLSNARKLFPTIEQTMETLWQEQLKRNDRLYNLSKFRLLDATVDESKIHLNIGITDYKEMICTNHLTCIEEIQKYGELHYNDRHACFGDALGVGGVVVTQDDFIVLIKRSNWVAESQGCYDTPGGHAEPEEMLKKLGKNNSELFQVDSSEVIYEIFHSFVREVRDEINVPESSLSWPLLLGVTRNKEYGWKPGMIFTLKCNLDWKQIEQLYLRGGAETDESTELKFIPLKELVMATKEDFIVLTSNMAPLGLLAMLLYVRHNEKLTN